MPRLRRKILIGLLSLPLILFLLAVSYLSLADLSGYRVTVGELVTDALGREMSIGGAFEPRTKWPSRWVASWCRVAAAWC